MSVKIIKGFTVFSSLMVAANLEMKQEVTHREGNDIMLIWSYLTVVIQI